MLTPSPSGGGIGGLTLAVALSHYPDIDVDIYESAHKFTEIGAGIGLWARQSHHIYFIHSIALIIPYPNQVLGGSYDR
jgi:NAD(P)-binding Rossmann-like domain